jgi:hypothetical protein
VIFDTALAAQICDKKHAGREKKEEVVSTWQ